MVYEGETVPQIRTLRIEVQKRTDYKNLVAYCSRVTIYRGIKAFPEEGCIRMNVITKSNVLHDQGEFKGFVKISGKQDILHDL